jgi:hypothetical protein
MASNDLGILKKRIRNLTGLTDLLFITIDTPISELQQLTNDLEDMN